MCDFVQSELASGKPCRAMSSLFHFKEWFRGCLLAGAAGEGLDAPVEFLCRRDIDHRFGASGIQSCAPVHYRLGAITDDTQMTLFPAEGMLRSWV